MKAGALREISTGEFVDDIRHQRDPRHPFGTTCLCDTSHTDRPVHRLPAGHRNRIVIKDFISYICLSRDRLTNRKRARVVPRALAQVLE